MFEHESTGKLSRLGPHLSDIHGRPMLRMTFDFPENDIGCLTF